MQHTKEIVSSKKATIVMVVLILLPFVFTLLMWTLSPSGYERCKNKLVNENTGFTWQPLQAGLKQVAGSFAYKIQ
jgi:hypothetical protein